MSSPATATHLRDASAGDAAAMAALLAAAWRAGYRGIVPDDLLELDVAEWEAHLAAPVEAGVNTIVAVDEHDRVVGFSRFGPDPDDPDPGAGYIASIYVDPASAGGGIGQRLVESAVERLAADGRDRVTLWVFRENARARALYERLGFVEDGAELVDQRWRTPQVRYRHEVAPAEGARDGRDGVLRVISPTEERNPRTSDLDVLPVLELLERINDEDARVPGAVRDALPTIAQLVEVTIERMRAGGRVHYFGAGSSGRLGLLDAAELPPTFGVDPELFVAHLAGGDRAVRRAFEGAEDDEEAGR
ncbi:MAG: GNAT family N-acetyltransferase, partial [Solirubrobacteraceae bacterium]